MATPYDEDEVGALTQIQDVFAGMSQTTPAALAEAERVLQEYHEGTAEDPFEETLRARQTQADEVRAVLQAARNRLEGEKESRAELLLAMSAGFGAPTRAGTFAESIGNVGQALVEPLAARRQRRAARAQDLTNIDLALARVDEGVITAQERAAQLERELQGKMALQAFKTLGKTVPGKGGRGTALRDRKINDLIELHGMSMPNAQALVDGLVDIEIVKETGHARLINKIDKSVVEIPLGQLNDMKDIVPELEDQYATSGIDYMRGEEDVRTDEEKLADGLVRARMDQGDSLWDMAGVATGPWSALGAGASIVSAWFGGPVAVSTIEGRQGLKIRSRELTRSLIDNPRMPVRLVEMALEDAAMSPEVLDDPELMQIRLVSLDRELWDKYLDAVEDANNPNLGSDFRSQQQQNARAMFRFLRDLQVPPDRQKRRTRAGTPMPGVTDKPEISVAPEGVDQSLWDLLRPEERALWD